VRPVFGFDAAYQGRSDMSRRRFSMRWSGSPSAISSPILLHSRCSARVGMPAQREAPRHRRARQVEAENPDFIRNYAMPYRRSRLPSRSDAC